MITHDLGVVAEIADEVVVMYAAEVVEQAPVERALRAAAHAVHVGPARLAAAARRRTSSASSRSRASRRRCSTRRRGCRFHPRCPYVMDDLQDRGSAARPGRRTSRRHLDACHLDEETKDREAREAARDDARAETAAAVDGRACRRRGAHGRRRGRAARRRGPEEALPGHPRDHLPEAGRRA